MKEGRLQAYYSTWGQEIINSDSLKRKRSVPLEKMIRLERLEEGTIQATTPSRKYMPRTEIEIEQAAKEKYEAQPLDKIILPENCENCFPISFSKPTQKEMKILQNAVFKAEDIEEQHTLEKPTKSEKNVFPCKPGTDALEQTHPNLQKDGYIRISQPSKAV